MEVMTLAALAKARDALTLALQGQYADDSLANAKARLKGYVEYCLRVLAAGAGEPNWNGASHWVRKYLDYQMKAAAGTASELMGSDDSNLSAHWLASNSERFLLESIGMHALSVPATVRRVLMASGFTANTVTEGDPKVVKHLMMTQPEIEPTKSAAIVVVTQEMVNAGGPSFVARFEQELINAEARANNAAVLTELAALSGSGTIDLSSTGDALDDLRLALRNADPSTGYVAAAEPGLVADLATRAEAAAGFSVRGGEFRPGIRIVAVDDHTGLTLVPCSRLALYDHGIEVRSARHATVNMADSPTSPSEVVSLWQTNSLGLLVERSFHLGGDVTLVNVVGS